MGILHLPCCTGRTLGLSVMEYLAGILPILSKQSGNIFFRSSILFTVVWSCNWGMFAEWSCKG